MQKPLSLAGGIAAALVLAACGASTPSPAGGQPQKGAASDAPSPTPTPIDAHLVVGEQGASNIITVAGKPTAPLPSDSNYLVEAAMGSGFLLAHTGAQTDDWGGWDDTDHLDYMAPDGKVTRLWNFASGTRVLGEMARRDGSEFGFITQGTVSGCGGSDARSAAEVWVGSSPNQAHKIATLPKLADDGTWQPYTWTAKGIVLAEGLGGGCAGEHLRINWRATDLMDPASGALTKLNSVLGDNCILQDMADDGTMLCLPYADSSKNDFSGILRVVHTDGSHTDLTPPADCTRSADNPGFGIGAVSIAPDAGHAAVATACPPPGGNGDLVVKPSLLDLTTGSFTVLTTGLQPDGWVDNGHLALDTFSAADPTTGQVVIADPSGATTKIATGNVQFVARPAES